MSNSNNTNETLEVIGQVLIRSFILGILVLFFSLGGLMLAGDLSYSVQSRILPITQEQFYALNYAGMYMVKAMLFVFFLFPYIAIRLLLCKNRKQGQACVFFCRCYTYFKTITIGENYE